MNGLVNWWGRNPVAGNLLMLACVIWGFLAYQSMDREFFPPGADNSVRVDASWPGASPADMESQVTIRIEEAIADIDGVDWVRSRSGEGYAWVNIEADPSKDMAEFTAEVRSRVESISGLPSALEPPRVTQNRGGQWAILLSVHGDVEERLLRDTAEQLRDRIALLPGAAAAQSFGGRQPEVSIEVSEATLRAYGLTFDDVARAVRDSSLNAAGGAVRTADGDFQLQVRALADTAREFGEIIIRQTPEGAVIRVKDVASVIDGFQDVNAYTRQDGERAVMISIATAEKFNIVETAKAVREFIAKSKDQLPEGVSITTVFDQSEDYNRLTGILFSNALQGFGLIFILLMLTLHPKVAIWSTLGVITAFAGSFIILPLFDVSISFITVFAFLLVLGIMVDDAIIVGEAIYERIERGERGADASILATQMVLKPLIASVATTALAFLPWAFLSGEVTQFTRTLTIVVMSTLLFSLIECLIILPAHLAHVEPLRPGRGIMGRIVRAQMASADAVVWFARNIYGPVMRLCVRWRWVTLTAALSIFMFAVSLAASGRIQQTFMPEVEGDFLQVSIQLPRTTPFSRMEEVAAELDRVRKTIQQETSERATMDPNSGAPSFGIIRSWSQAIDENSVQAWISLTPPETRPDLRTGAVRDRLKELLGDIPDAERISFEFNGGGGGPAIQIALLGDNQDELRAAVEDLKAKLLSYSQISSVRDSEEAAIEELRFTLKPGAEQLGVTLADVSRQVRQAYFGEEAQRLPRDGDDVRVYVRYPANERKSLESLGDFRVRASDGREIPLRAIADVEFAPGVTWLDRRQRMSTITVEAEAPQEARAEVMRDLNASGFLETLEKKYPSVTRRAIGQAEAQAEFQSQLGAFGLMALFAMYALLAVVFKSYWQPALIMSVIPFAFVGAAVGHWLFGMSFALFSWLGMIAAMGVIVNDNVVLVDKANHLREEGADGFEAITEAGVTRFRQIFLTSVTEFVGLAPMIMEMAVIAQFLKPMAVGLAFGVLLAMPATLILTPALYMIGKDIKGWIGRLQRFFGRMLGPRAAATTAE